MDDPDLSARQHLAANDPAFPARREEAWGRIVAALDGVLMPAGYGLSGTTWSRLTAAGKSAVHLQRSRYGWDVQIVLRFVTPDGEVPDHPDWPGGEDVTLAEFFERAEGDPGTLAFIDVLERPECLDLAVDTLREQVLPWFEALHQEDPPRT
ncbi:hypothetical protein [Tabrizicola sp.]|uniref:hypothetical protein n=1 Tax=Tabrizicola sp. TaxID=2005166 RepID=UPI0025D7DBB8|nr:hypothetical protein [Tabrizicola sp.]MBY0350663.1 hypothetical protein [Tabrizicola sp.]